MIEFKKLRSEDLELVLKWRLQESVSQYLFTKVENDMAKQIAWYKKVSADPSYKYWIIYFNQKPIGVFNLHNLDLTHKKTNAGFYIGEEEYRTMGSLIPPYFYNYIFRDLKLDKIYGEVVDGNSIIKIHQMHGYKIVGTSLKQLPEDKGIKEVHAVELLAEDWAKLKKYERYICSFEQ